MKLGFRNELKMTERKHFKSDPEPNMLSWSEKNQIKLLHSEDPVKWNFDELSKSFPATPQIIKKVIKSSWRPGSNNRIKSHDQKVSKNWEAFNEGKLQISNPLLKEHLKTFTRRISLPLQSDDSETSFKRELSKPQETEFSNIIHSYELLKESVENKKDLHNHKHSKKSLNHTKSVDCLSSEDSAAIVYREVDEVNVTKRLNIKSKSPYTLDKLREELREQQGKIDIESVNIQDRELLKGETSITTVVPNQSSNLDVFPSKNIAPVNSTQPKRSIASQKDNSLQYSSSNQDNTCLAISHIKSRIHIPKNKVKVGYLYKIKDCFYSHDGFFLYKVPGKIDESG